MTGKYDAAWTEHGAQNSHTGKDGKQYRNMRRFTRPCQVCADVFEAFLPANSPVNARPTLTTCEAHRGAPQAIRYGYLRWDAATRQLVPGPKCGAGGSDEIRELREVEVAWGAIWSETFDVLKPYGLTHMGNYADAVKALAAKTDLGAALQSAAKNKMPWERK